MASRARLIPTRPKPSEQVTWHTVKSGVFSSAELAIGQRRMEAESYLSSGYGVRRAIEGRRDWVPFGKLAGLSAPPRIKQIFVSREFGVPYLNTSQVFETRPAPRKFLATGKTSKAKDRLAAEGTILVMASASPGRSTLVTAAHEGSFISHHFMRVAPRDDSRAGWIYGFLRSPQGQQMMSGSQYASIIRHIEPHHVAALPVPCVSDEIALRFTERVSEVRRLRNRAFELAEYADRLFEDALGPIVLPQSTSGFSVNSSELTGRRRLEATFHSPVAAGISRLFKRSDRLSDITERVWWMPRFRRFYGESGIPYMSADELFTVSPQGLKKILVGGDESYAQYLVNPGWIVMACSGQVYGTNGQATLVTERHKNMFFSHDLIRIIPKDGAVRAGYMLTALTHRTHGRPLLIREAYGTSIPHLDPGDVANFPVVRLDSAIEERIADAAEESAIARFEADACEVELSKEAGKLIDCFISGESLLA